MLVDKYSHINIIPILAEHEKVFVSVDEFFTCTIKEKIILKYGSLKKYAVTLGIDTPTFSWAFKKKNGHQLRRLFKICEDTGVSRKELYQQIKGYYSWGSHNKPIQINKFIDINPIFAEGYALYIAEGDTGYSGTKRARKFRLTNSEPDVINFFMRWLERFFPAVDYYFVAALPLEGTYENNLREIILKNKRLKITSGRYNRKIKYRVCMDNVIVTDLILDLKEKIRTAVLQNKELAAAYVRGIMIGEGTVYDNRSRYVRLEMKNPSEIKFVKRLLERLGISYTYHVRSTRENMESLYIGGRENIRKYYELVGFGCHRKRQEKLTKLVESGIHSISLNPDTVIKTTFKIAETEKQLGMMK